MHLKQSVKLFLIIFFVVICFRFHVVASVQYETDHFRLTILTSGQVESFVDLRNGANYADAKDTRFCVLRLQKSTAGVAADQMVQNGDILTFSFPGTAVAVKLQVTVHESHLIFDVVEITGGDFYDLQFARVALIIDYQKDDFAASAMSRKLHTSTLEFPGKSNLIGGQCYKAHGWEGAGVFLLGMPEVHLRETMQQVVASYPPGEMPVNLAGGPFAMDHPKNYGSYVIVSEAITEQQVDEWVAHLSRFGVTQVDFHQGTPFRQGDFHFNEKAYPNGVADFRKMSEAFRKHGFITGLHTYAQYIDVNSQFVTPVPSKDLDAMGTYALTDDLDTDETTVRVDISTADISETVGWSIRNSKVIRIDDELMIFDKPSRTAPYGFTSCQRGAYGTKVSAHSKGARVEHIVQLFDMFIPKDGSELFLEVARETARAYNEGGFGMIYLDALWSPRTDDYDLGRYYETLFVNELLKHVETPPLLEYGSFFATNLWYGRSRMGAWDTGHRGYRQFFDKHIEANHTTADPFYLPGHMGWMALCPSNGDNADNFQYHIMFQEDVEYLGAKILAYNYSLSYNDIHKNIAQPFAYRNGNILKNYDSLRRVGYFPPETLERLRDPNADFLLQHSGDDWRLTEANYERTLLRPDVREFSYSNPYPEQTPMIRIEHRHQPVAYTSSEGIDLIAFNETLPVSSTTTRNFSPPINLSNHLGMGFWIFGDGGNQRINIQVEAPSNLMSGYTDHTVTVDFEGWRYFALAEADNGMINKAYPCPMHEQCGDIYKDLRQTVYYNSISRVQMQIEGETKNLRFRTVRALPLQHTNLVNPTLEMDGKSITFQGNIRTGQYMEYTPGGHAVVYNAVGREVSEMQQNTPVFKLPTGDATIKFSATDPSGNNPVRITLRTDENPPPEKDNPPIPTDLSATYGQILSDVALPAGWSWVDETKSVGNVGVQTHEANYTPDDPKKYYAMTNVGLKVTVKDGGDPEITSSEEILAYPLRAWIHNRLLHVTGLTPGETLSVYTATGALEYHSIAISNEADIKLKVMGVYIVQSGGKSIKVVFH